MLQAGLVLFSILLLIWTPGWAVALVSHTVEFFTQPLNFEITLLNSLSVIEVALRSRNEERLGS